MYIDLHVTYLLLLSDFNETRIFFTNFRKTLIVFHEIHPLGAELYHADRQTDGRADMTKLIFAFRSFANAPKNYNL